MSISNFVLPKEIAALPLPQQDAIRKVLVDSGLMTGTGEIVDLSPANISPAHKAAVNATLTSFGIRQDVDALAFGFDFGVGCILARAAEVGAVALCASIPGGQVAIALCIAAAHAAADEACK